MRDIIYPLFRIYRSRTYYSALLLFHSSSFCEFLPGFSQSHIPIVSLIQLSNCLQPFSQKKVPNSQKKGTKNLFNRVMKKCL